MRKLISLFYLIIFGLNSNAQSGQWVDTVLLIHFETGKSLPINEDKNRVLLYLNDSNREFVFTAISSYTDTVGSISDNLILAERRSKNIADLLRTQKFDLANIKYTNYGKSNPFSNTDNSLNRKVEIYLKYEIKNRNLNDTSKYVLLTKIEISNIDFEPDKAILTPSSMLYLDDLAKLLLSYKEDIFEIKGHVNWNPTAKSLGDSGYRLKMYELSADRAKAIYEILTDKGIPAAQMFWKGVGNAEMLYPNASNDEEKRKNMRVEIVIFSKHD